MKSKIDWNSLALTALAQYNVSVAQLVFLGHSENVTFRVETWNNQNFATSGEYVDTLRAKAAEILRTE